MIGYKSLLKWHKEEFQTTLQFPQLKLTWSPPPNLQGHHLQPLNISELLSDQSPNLQLVANYTIKEWKAILEKANSSKESTMDENDPTTVDNEKNLGLELDIINNNNLQPNILPHEPDQISTQPQNTIEENTPPSTVIDLVTQQYPLNQKQRFVAITISDAFSWKDHPYDSTKRNQRLMYIGGKGGTGKTQIIKAVIAAMALYHRRQEIIVMVWTGSAADSVDGNTCSTSLGIGFGKIAKQSSNSTERVQRLGLTRQ
jgi:AAA domain